MQNKIIKNALPGCILLLLSIGIYCLDAYLGMTINGDAVIFTTVCRQMWNGGVLYVDSVDWKGPWLFFLWMLPAKLGKYSPLLLNSMIIISYYYLIDYITKKLEFTNALFVKVISTLCVCAMSVWTDLYLPEGFMVLILPWIYYVLKTKSILYNKYTALVVGVIVGLLFWSKISLCGIFVPVYLYLLIYCIKEKQIKHLVQSCALSLVSFIVISIVPFIYFGYYHAIDTLFKVYFKENSSYLDHSFVANLSASEIAWIITVSLVFLQAVVILLHKHKYLEFVVCTASILSMFIAVVFNNNFGYQNLGYLVILAVFLLEFSNYGWISHVCLFTLLTFVFLSGLIKTIKLTENSDMLNYTITPTGYDTISIEDIKDTVGNANVQTIFCQYGISVDFTVNDKYFFIPRSITEGNPELCEDIRDTLLASDAEYVILPTIYGSSYSDWKELTMNMLWSPTMSAETIYNYFCPYVKRLTEDYEVVLEGVYCGTQTYVFKKK